MLAACLGRSVAASTSSYNLQTTTSTATWSRRNSTPWTNASQGLAGGTKNEEKGRETGLLRERKRAHPTQPLGEMMVVLLRLATMSSVASAARRCNSHQMVSFSEDSANTRTDEAILPIVTHGTCFILVTTLGAQGTLAVLVSPTGARDVALYYVF